MGTFAEVSGGTVTNVAIATAATNLPAAGATWVQIDGLSPQPAIGWSYAGGAFTAPVVTAPAPTLAQQAAAASVAGLTVALTGSITLAATLFPTDAATQIKLAAVMTTVSRTGAFAGGATTFPMLDSTGNWHTFTVAQWTAVAEAIDNFVTACDLIATGNPLNATALPASSVTLAV